MMAAVEATGDCKKLQFFLEFLQFLQPAWKPFHHVELDISNLEPHFHRFFAGVREFSEIRALELQITLSEHKIHYYERRSDYA